MIYKSLLLISCLISKAFSEAISCADGKMCPQEFPCCSTYYICNKKEDYFGGCDPRFSFELGSCAPAPICKNDKTTFNSLDVITRENLYFGDSDNIKWLYSGTPVKNNNNTLLTIPKRKEGTVIQSTHYVWYGNVKVRLRSSRGPGIITAIVLMSGAKDEIDFEFVGADLGNVQSNYYHHGVLDWTKSVKIPVSNTYEEFHVYEINWTPEKIEFLIDGKIGRTILRADTYNPQTKQYEYPQTPSQVFVSIWPAGREDSPEGTTEWAGGRINWDSEDIQKYGHFAAELDYIQIDCYDGHDPSEKSYIYNSRQALEENVLYSKELRVHKNEESKDLNSRASVEIFPTSPLAPALIPSPSASLQEEKFPNSTSPISIPKSNSSSTSPSNSISLNSSELSTITSDSPTTPIAKGSESHGQRANEPTSRSSPNKGKGQKSSSGNSLLEDLTFIKLLASLLTIGSIMLLL